MIVCLIEFETLPGQEVEQQRWLARLMPEVEKMPGFRGKESYNHISGDGRVSTISYWDDEVALKKWTQNIDHQKAMKEGRQKIFSRYDIRICSEIRHYGYKREPKT